MDPSPPSSPTTSSTGHSLSLSASLQKSPLDVQIIHQGFLQKRGGGNSSFGYRKRWFVLRRYIFADNELMNKNEYELSYYQNPKDPQPSGMIHLDDRYDIYPAELLIKKNKFSFVITPIDSIKFVQADAVRSYFLMTTTQSDLIDWLTALRQALDDTKGIPQSLPIERRLIPPKTLFRGYLLKQGGGRKSKGWRTRWIVLRLEPPQPFFTRQNHDPNQSNSYNHRPCTLSYYQTNQDTEPSGMIYLSDQYCVDIQSSEKDHIFSIRPIEGISNSIVRSFYFCAATRREMESWVDAIKSAINGNFTSQSQTEESSTSQEQNSLEEQTNEQSQETAPRKETKESTQIDEVTIKVQRISKQDVYYFINEDIQLNVNSKTKSIKLITTGDLCDWSVDIQRNPI